MDIDYGCPPATKRILRDEVAARAKLGDEAQKNLFIAMKALGDFSFYNFFTIFMGRNLTCENKGDCLVFRQDLTRDCSLVFIPQKETGYNLTSLSINEIKLVDKVIIKEVVNHVR